MDKTATMTPTKSSRVTLVDIAKVAGMSLSTVSAALHQTGKISDKRKRIVQDLAWKMGYQVNPAARLMRSRHSGIIGILIEVVHDGYSQLDSLQESILQHSIQHCENTDHAYHVSICRHFEQSGTADDRKNQIMLSQSELRALGNGLIDGLLVVGYLHQPLYQAVRTRPLPRVTLLEPDDYCVLLQASTGFEAAVRRFYDLGHRQIAYIGGTEKHAGAVRARDTFVRTIQSLGLSLPQNWVYMSEIVGYRERRAGYAKILAHSSALLREKVRPTAFVCHGNDLARTVMYAAMENGLRVPRDVSVIGHGQRSTAEEGAPLLSFIEPDTASLVREGLDMLHKLIDDQKLAPMQRIAGESIVEGQTIAPPLCKT